MKYAEAEVKYEINISEFEDVKSMLNSLGYRLLSSEQLIDYIVSHEKSSLGGFDLERIRQSGDKFIYTKKTWKEINGSKTRMEEEYAIDSQAAQNLIANYKPQLSMKKIRETYKTENLDAITVSFDFVKMDNKESIFIECEKLVGIAKAEEARKEIFDFMHQILKISKRDEAPGMISIMLGIGNK